MIEVLGRRLTRWASWTRFLVSLRETWDGAASDGTDSVDDGGNG